MYSLDSALARNELLPIVHDIVQRVVVVGYRRSVDVARQLGVVLLNILHVLCVRYGGGVSTEHFGEHYHQLFELFVLLIRGLVLHELKASFEIFVLRFQHQSVLFHHVGDWLEVDHRKWAGGDRVKAALLQFELLFVPLLLFQRFLLSHLDDLLDEGLDSCEERIGRAG